MRFLGLGNKTGCVTGYCTRVHTPFRKLTSDNPIILLDNADAAAVVLLDKVSAVCVFNGGLTSHLAIICTEMNLPFVTLRGVKANILSEKIITLDSTSGEICIIDSKIHL